MNQLQKAAFNVYITSVSVIRIFTSVLWMLVLAWAIVVIFYPAAKDVIPSFYELGFWVALCYISWNKQSRIFGDKVPE